LLPLSSHLIAMLVPYTTLFRSYFDADATSPDQVEIACLVAVAEQDFILFHGRRRGRFCKKLQERSFQAGKQFQFIEDGHYGWGGDRKSTRLNSSHVSISYAVFC